MISVRLVGFEPTTLSLEGICSVQLSYKRKYVILRINMRYLSMKNCTKCKTIKPLVEFYTRRFGTEPSSYCKPCTNNQTLDRQRKLKEQAVAYKGGSCLHCGYDKYYGALEFHHLDPTQKEFSLAHQHCTKFDKIKEELDKCILLCSNCHKEEHARLKGLLSI